MFRRHLNPDGTYRDNRKPFLDDLANLATFGYYKRQRKAKRIAKEIAAKNNRIKESKERSAADRQRRAGIRAGGLLTPRRRTGLGGSGGTLGGGY